jgi:hypothetical protein
MDLGHQWVAHCPGSNIVLTSSAVPPDGNPYTRIKGSCLVVLVAHHAVLLLDNLRCWEPKKFGRLRRQVSVNSLIVLDICWTSEQRQRHALKTVLYARSAPRRKKLPTTSSPVVCTQEESGSGSSIATDGKTLCLSQLAGPGLSSI